MNTHHSRKTEGKPASCVRLLVVCLAVLAAVMSAAGCDKLPKWSDMTGEKKKEEMPAAPKQAPKTSAAPAVSPQPAKFEPPKLTPQEMIAKFQSTPTQQRTNAMLLELASLKEGLEQFNEMNLSQSPVTDAGLAAMPKFERLEKLSLDSCRVSSGGLQHLTKMKNLSSLSLMFGAQADPNSDRAIGVLSGMPQLTTLRLDRAIVTEEGLRHLAEMGSLESLSVANVALANDHMQYISRLTGLKDLNLSYTQINDDGLAGLLPLTALESLTIAGVPQVKGRGLKELVIGHKALLKLKSLGIYDNPDLGTDAYEAIFRLKKLEALHADGANLNDQLFVHAVAPLSNLQALSIGRDKCTSLGMAALPKLRKLKTFAVDRDPAIDDSALPAIAKLKLLEQLTLSDSICTEFRLRELKKKNPKLEIVFNQKKIE